MSEEQKPDQKTLLAKAYAEALVLLESVCKGTTTDPNSISAASLIINHYEKAVRHGWMNPYMRKN